MATLLGEIQELRGRRTPTIGQWLVVFRDGLPISMNPPGVGVRRMVGAPVFRANVATLDTSPHQVRVSLRDLHTQDGFVINSISADVMYQLSPEEADASSEILKLIGDHGYSFADILEKRMENSIDQYARSVTGNSSAANLMRIGPQQALFGGSYPPAPLAVRIIAVRVSDWTRSSYAQEILDSKQRDAVRSATLDSHIDELRTNQKLDALKMMFAQQARISDALAEEKLSEIQVRDWLNRAKQLEIDPLALAVPEQWAEANKNNRMLAEKLLENPQVFSLLRAKPDLLVGLQSRLGPPETLSRRQNSALDALDSNRAMLDPGAVYVNSGGFRKGSNISQFYVDGDLAETWSGAGLDRSDLRGACWKRASGRVAVIFVFTSENKLSQRIPPQLETRLKVIAGSDERIRISWICARSLTEFFDGLVVDVLDQRPGRDRLRSDARFRTVSGRSEILIIIDENHPQAITAFKRLSNPFNPMLDAVHGLLHDRARIRFCLGQLN